MLFVFCFQSSLMAASSDQELEFEKQKSSSDTVR